MEPHSTCLHFIHGADGAQSRWPLTLMHDQKGSPRMQRIGAYKMVLGTTCQKELQMGWLAPSHPRIKIHQEIVIGNDGQ